MTRDDFDWIEAWLDDSLSAEERQTFAARLEAEPALRAAMREQQEAVVAFRMLEKEQAREQLKAQWQEVKKEQNVRPAKVRPMTSPWLWLGAAAAIVLILLLVFRPDAKPQTPQQLAMAYFDADTPGLTKGGETIDSLLQEAGTAYRMEHFAEAEILFEQILATTPDIRALYYMALSQMAQQKWAEAKRTLEGLNASPIYDEQARWNLALIDLQQGNLPSARTRLQYIITAAQHYKKAEAEALIEALRSE